MSKLFTLLSIIRTKLNIFFPLTVISTGTSNPSTPEYLPRLQVQAHPNLITLVLPKKTMSYHRLKNLQLLFGRYVFHTFPGHAQHTWHWPMSSWLFFLLVLLEYLLLWIRKQCNFGELLVAVCYLSGIDFESVVEILLGGCHFGGLNRTKVP